jgi:hypothetical protein
VVLVVTLPRIWDLAPFHPKRGIASNLHDLAILRLGHSRSCNLKDSTANPSATDKDEKCCLLGCDGTSPTFRRTVLLPSSASKDEPSEKAESWGSSFLRNVGELPDYTALHPRI